MSEPDLKVDKYFEGKISIREFLVDFFASLMPGVFFLILTIPALIIPLYIAIQTLDHFFGYRIVEIFLIPDEITQLYHMPAIFDIVFVLLFLAFGYIIGTVFYRSDPKDPDFYSYKKISKEIDKSNWVIKESKDGLSPKDVQYPYNNLHIYLLKRGRKDLADKIPWRNNVDLRSKIFINSVKIRLQFYFPENCSTIVKNGAHVRLSSSMWFMCKRLKKVSLIGISIIILFSLPLFLWDADVFQKSLFHLIIASTIEIFIILLVIWIKSSIEKFLHYQRVREIFHVLDTAMVASIKLEEDMGNKIFVSESISE